MCCHQPQKMGRTEIPLKSVLGLMQFGIDWDDEMQSILTKLAGSASTMAHRAGVQNSLLQVAEMV